MKKLYYFFFASAMCLGACSDNEVITSDSQSKTPITISVYSQGQTRLTETSLSTMERDSNGFKLLMKTGDKTLVNKACVFSTSTSTWSYGTDPVYWPSSTTTAVNFYGIFSPGSSLDITTSGSSVTSTIPVDGAKDIVATTTSATMSNDGSVSLAFEHIFGQIYISAKSAVEGYTCKVSDVIITTPANAVYDFDAKTLTASGSNTTLTYFNGGANAAKEVNFKAYTAIDDTKAMILPAMNLTISVTYTVVDPTGLSSTPKTVPASFTPVAGKANRLNLDLSVDEKPISVTVGRVSDWAS